MTKLWKFIYWVSGIFLLCVLYNFFGGTGESFDKTNTFQWIGEVVFIIGGLVGLGYISTLIWKD